MPALVAGIHAVSRFTKKLVGGQTKSGHDGY